MAKRLIAVVAAVAMIVGAVIVRRQVLDKKSVSGDTPSSSTAAQATGDIVCTPDLIEACRSAGLGAREMTVVDVLASSAPPSYLVAIDPVGAMLVDRLRPAKSASAPVASSPLVVAGPDERLKVLEAACPGVAAKCLAAKAGVAWSEVPGASAAWGTIDVQTRDAARFSDGLFAFAALASGLVEPDELSTATLAAAASRAGEVKKVGKNRNDPITDPLAIRFRLVVTPLALIGPQVATRPIGATVAAVSLTTFGGNVSEATVKALTTAFGNRGWSAGVAPSGPDAIAGEAALDFWKRT